MPIFDYAKIKWVPNNNKLGVGYQKNLVFGGLIPKDEFYKNMKLKKSQGGFKCIICDKKKVKGTRYIGGHYDSICYNCISEWVNNSNKTLSGIKEIMEKIEEEVKENKEKWDKEVLVNSLG